MLESCHGGTACGAVVPRCLGGDAAPWGRSSCSHCAISFNQPAFSVYRSFFARQQRRRDTDGQEPPQEAAGRQHIPHSEQHSEHQLPRLVFQILPLVQQNSRKGFMTGLKAAARQRITAAVDQQAALPSGSSSSVGRQSTCSQATTWQAV